MKKLFISLIASLISVLFVGMQAQGITSLPQTSTESDPIWYDLTHGLDFTVISVNASGEVELTAGDAENKTQMFRFEKDGDGYAIINNNGKYLSTTMEAGKVVLSATKSLWTLSYNDPFQATSISTTGGGLQPAESPSLTIAGTATSDKSYWAMNLRTEPLDMPIISDDENEVWYYLLNQRGYPTPTKNAITDMNVASSVAEVSLMASAVSATNNGQLWKFIEVDGQLTLKSKNGNFMNGFSTDGSISSSIELLNSNGSPGAWQISVNGEVMHVNHNLTISAYAQGPESYHVIVSEGDYWGVELKSNVTRAETLLAAATIGTGVGQFTEEAKATFQAAITSAKTIADNTASTGVEITLAASALMQAQNAFNASVGMPKFSTESESNWYYIRSTFKGYSVLKEPYAATRADDDRIALTLAATGDSYLWKLTAGTNGTYIIENKTKAGSIQTAKPPVIAEGPMNEWNVTFRGNGQFTLTAADGIEFHADQAGVVVNWNASPIDNSASCWTFIAPIVDKEALLTSITAATTLKTDAVVGSKGGQYPQEAVTTLEAAITVAQTAYDKAELTLDEFFIESNAIAEAIIDFKTKMNPAYEIAVEGIANKAYRLKYIGTGENNGKFLTNPRTESENDLASTGGRPQARFSDVEDGTTAFKFMGSVESSTHFTIHNDRGVSGLTGGGDYLDENGRMRPASIFVDEKWYWFALKAEDATLAAGTKVGLFSTFSEKYVIARADTAITRMSVDSNPALVFELIEIGPASVEESTNASIRVVAQDGRISVYGTEGENYDIFSVNGVKQSKAARLSKGAYFVRIEDKAYKVIVK